MKLTGKFLAELQRRLKVGNRRGVHLNAIPAKSKYKFDLNRLSYIDKNLPNNFIKALLTEHPLKFKVSWKDNIPDLNFLFEEEQTQLVRITKAFENLINQTEAIESEKGINTFGFGFPILVRRDNLDNKLTVAPILIWSLRIKRTKEFNTWEILRNEDDPVYLNEVLINHLQSDSNIEISQIPSDMLDDGLISKEELVKICADLIRTINTASSENIEKIFEEKLDNIVSIGEKPHYEKLPLNSTNSFIEFGGLFSIFEVQKQNIINDYKNLMELEGVDINLDNLEEHYFQPISSIETDPSQQSILYSLEDTRNILIQGPPGTGKSQTLTAILINALENNKKTIVVCEKRTALEVLHNALIEKSLNYHCVLIRDIVKDRKVVVDSVRDRVDDSEYKRYSYNFSKETLDHITTQAKDLISTINKKHQKLDKKLIGQKSWTDLVGNLLAELKETTSDINLNIDRNIFCYTSQELSTLLKLVQKGQILYADFAPIESRSFINPLKFEGDNPYIIEQKINDDFEKYFQFIREIKTLYKLNEKEYYALRKSHLENQVLLINNSLSKIFKQEKDITFLNSEAKKNYFKLRENELAQQIENLLKIINPINAIFSNNKNNPYLINDIKVNSLGFKLLSIFSKSKKQTIEDYLSLQKYFAELQEQTQKSKDFQTINFNGSLESKKQLFDKLNEEIEIVQKTFRNKIIDEFSLFDLLESLNINSADEAFQFILFEINNSKNSAEFRETLTTILSSFQSYQSELKLLFQQLSFILSDSVDIKLKYTFDKSFEENKRLLSEIQDKIETIKANFDSKTQNEFFQIDLIKANPSEITIESLPILQKEASALFEKIKKDNWTIEKIDGLDLQKTIINIEVLIGKKKCYFEENNESFITEFKWFQFYDALSEDYKLIVTELKRMHNWRKSFLVFYLNSILVNSANIDLPTNDNEHIELEKTLTGIEKEQLKYIKEFWFSKQIDSTREFEFKNKNLSVANLYNKRSSNNFRRLSLRQIVQYDANLFTDFFPIVLTSPDVACNLFKGMNGYFDIVMFDEASQLKIEDNLPAILKGKQIIIAGDEHQMPPSNYFSKVFDGFVDDEDDLEEEDEIVVDKDNMLLSCESLLDFASELNFQKKHLDFHYRSRHPFLIDFSNYAFYNQRLKPLPNTFDYIPIKYIQVGGAFFEYTNDAEAEMVLSIIDKNIHRLPNGEYPTVGIATFNITQRNLIKSKILERQKFSKYEEFNTKIQELEKNGMFIKNLENIQGDERDVIILSTTYGISKDGKFAQRFGPINHSKGYKLLNVIITRAKYKIYVCSSIPEQVFMNYKDYLVTEGNNKRAVLYAYLAYSKAISENNEELRLSVLTALSENTTKSVSFDSFKGNELESPFEEEVYQSLVNELGDEKLIPQLQYAGFRIDIAYDPKIKGAPKIAIECDGAKYHSSREAYLYDRRRQKILENNGFVFHRIWSTNWWRNASRETTKLIDFIKQIESTQNYNYMDFSSMASAFTDAIEIKEHYIDSNALFGKEKDTQLIDLMAQNENRLICKNSEKIQLNSTVQVRYMNNGENLNIQIVSTGNNKNSKDSDTHKVYYKSPIAIALLGHEEGNIVKIGSLDNFVEIIKIYND